MEVNIMELKEKILKSVFEGVGLIETEYMTEDEIIAMIGGIGLGVECVFQNIEDNYEIRVEVASEILNKLQDKYIKSKENIRYWESL